MKKTTFKPVQKEHFQMMHDRLKKDHIQGFYDGGEESFEEYSQGMIDRMNNSHQFSYIFLIDDVSVGYIQCYDCYGIAEDVYGNLVEKGTWGVDMYIGDEKYLGKGYGASVLKEFVGFVIKTYGATQISIDPTPTNVRAVGAYKKAGFETIKEFVIDGNTHLLMLYGIKLIKPSLDYLNSFTKAVISFKKDGRNGFWNVGGEELTLDGVEQYIIDTKYYEKGERLPNDRKHSHTYRLVDVNSGDFLGCINIRHELNDFLEKYGGHIGYAVAPNQRKKGYGSLILKMALGKVREDTGLKRVLLTCDESNVGSKKIIEKNGGVYENKLLVTGKEYYKLRYWIEC